MKIIVLVVLLLAGPALASEDVYGTLNNCTTGGTPCAATKVFNLQEKTVFVDYTSGTLSAAVECQLVPGGTWAVIQGTIAADAVVSVPQRCWQIRINPATCTTCVYTAVYSGFPARK